MDSKYNARFTLEKPAYSSKKKHSIYRAGAYQSAEITNDMASLDDSQRSTKLCAQQTAATRQSLE